MEIPEKLLYTKDHEWLSINNNTAIIGITDYAQGELGDIIFIEFPEIGAKFNQGDPMGTIEAVKTVADIYAPISGRVGEVNRRLEEEPDIINREPYEGGWIVKLTSIPNDKSNLLSFKEYKSLIK